MELESSSPLLVGSALWSLSRNVEGQLGLSSCLDRLLDEICRPYGLALFFPDLFPNPDLHPHTIPTTPFHFSHANPSATSE
jgi:hypothetical protein